MTATKTRTSRNTTRTRTRTQSTSRRQATSRGQASARTQGRTRTQTTTRKQTPTRRTRPVRTTRHTPSRGRSSAAQKAYARRAQRSTAVRHAGGVAARNVAGSVLKLRLPTTRASFVLLMMALLAAGVGLTMWLSTQAIADSYRLEDMKTQNAKLAEQADQLQEEVATQDSAGSLAQRAKGLGMVTSGHPARLLVRPHGKPKVVGDETPASKKDQIDQLSEAANAG